MADGNWFIGSKDRPSDLYVTRFGTIFWAIVIAVLGAAIISAVVNLWPTVDPTLPAGAAATQQDAAAQAQHKVTFLWGAFDLSLNKSTGLIVLAFVVGALGSFVQASLAFVSWVGNRELKVSWVWWYGFRLFSGGALALIVYLGIRGGLFGGQNSTTEVNAYGTAAFAGLVGLFSKQAIAKLQEVFNNLFRTDSEESATADPGTTKTEAGQGIRP
jgi:hypothetical protein